MTDRLRLAVPNKGRLVEPTLALLHDAGLVFESTDRSLVARVRNFDLDILFVRTNDVIEFVRDAVADLAVPADSPYQSLQDLSGLRVATAHPNATRSFFAAQSVPIEVIPISGAVEVAPRLGLAEAIVDLVSSGSTLIMNGLRPIADVLASEAVLVANPDARDTRSVELKAIETMLSAVIAARDKKYLMMNALASKLAELEALLPGLSGPSVIPLAHEGMIAIHSVVEADAVWGLLPRLKAAGASGILVLPIEKIVP